MDKIDFTGASLIGASLRPGAKAGPNKASAKSESQGTARGIHKSLFSDLLEKNTVSELGPLRELAPSEEAIAELMDAVHSAGSDLIDRPFHDEIIKYKKAVRDFIHYVVENGFTINKSQTNQRKLRNLQPHVQIQVIDRKLEELAAAILSGQTTQLTRVSKLDEITGLLVDLTVTGSIRTNND